MKCPQQGYFQTGWRIFYYKFPQAWNSHYHVDICRWDRFEIHAFFAAYMNYRPRPCSLALNEYIGEPILLTVYMYTLVFRYWSAVTGRICIRPLCVFQMKTKLSDLVDEIFLGKINVFLWFILSFKSWRSFQLSGYLNFLLQCISAVLT